MKKLSICFGLVYPNAILFGIFIVFISFVGFMELSYINLDIYFFIEVIVLILILLIGLFPLSTYNFLSIDLLKNELSIGIIYFFIFKHTKKYYLSDFNSIKIIKSKSRYHAGGGYLTTAVNFFSKNENDLLLLNNKAKDNIRIPNIGNDKLANKQLLKINTYTQYVFKN